MRQDSETILVFSAFHQFRYRGNARPRVLALAPLSDTGSSATFNAVFAHLNGTSNIYLRYPLVLPTPNVVSFTAAGSAHWRIERGATWEIAIEDPGRALPSSDKIDAPALACGVIGDSGAFVRSSLVQSDARSRIYRVAVPIARSFALSLSSRLVRFTDDAGKDLAFPHARVQLPVRQKGATSRIVVRAVALTPAEKEQVKYK